MLVAGGRGLGAYDRAVGHRIDAPLHIFGGERSSVVKANALPQMENISQWIRDVPSLCYPGMQIEMLIFAYKRIEKQLIDTLRESVCPNSRIEIRGTALDEHRDCVRIRMRTRATNKKQA